MTQTLGLRERKKARTRQVISDAARRLFAERGFEAVTVAEVAAEAEVSEATVFNYFATKEDLLYSRLEEFEEELLGAIRDRPVGESVVSAFGRFVSQTRGALAAQDEETFEHLASLTRVILASPALLAREQQVFARYTAALAALIAQETGDAGVEPQIVASALLGVHRGLIDYSRAEIAAGTRNPLLARRVRAQAKRAIALLEAGLGGYGVRGT